VFLAGGRALPPQQVGLIGRSSRFRLAVPPAPADVKAELGGQLHHIVVIAAVPQRLAQVGLRFAQGHEGIELLDLVEELLELRFGH